jgi:hypothetical protein
MRFLTERPSSSIDEARERRTESTQEFSLATHTLPDCNLKPQLQPQGQALPNSCDVPNFWQGLLE